MEIPQIISLLCIRGLQHARGMAIIKPHLHLKWHRRRETDENISSTSASITGAESMKLRHLSCRVISRLASMGRAEWRNAQSCQSGIAEFPWCHSAHQRAEESRRAYETRADAEIIKRAYFKRAFPRERRAPSDARHRAAGAPASRRMRIASAPGRRRRNGISSRRM